MTYTHSPDWVADLVIYEIATRNFTSPDGPESGTFRSLEEKVPYVSELGANGIWLTGHNLANASHFYNIWTQYAVVRPDVVDPVLGSEEEFRSLIQSAHSYGIRVFLDVVTHGVMNDSPLVTDHPEWFREGTWGMTDYDWFGQHADLDEWWVNTWVRYVAEFGVDGYRLDVNMYRPDLWWRIKEECRQAGHEIIVFHETGPGRRGVADFLQWGIRHKISTERFNPTDQRIMRLPHTLRRASQNDVHVGYAVTVELEGGEVWSNSGSGDHWLSITDATIEHAPDPNPRGPEPYGADEVVLRLAGLPRGGAISGITVDPVAKMTSGAVPGAAWTLSEGVHSDYRVTYSRDGDDLVVRLPEHLPNGSVLSLQLSCHDDGWDGFPSGENPYVAGTSRFAMGYGMLLAPAVPIFMSGEEFAADYVPNPRLTPGLFGKGKAGEGTWLYGSWIQWTQLHEPRHADMLQDVKRLVRLRHEYRELIRPLESGKGLGSFITLDVFEPRTMPMPYGYCSEEALLIVAGNPYERSGHSVAIDVPWNELPLRSSSTYRVQDLWNEGNATTETGRGETLVLHVGPDRTTGGGVCVWKLTPAEAG